MMTLKTLTRIAPLAVVAGLLTAAPADAAPIAGVDFENGAGGYSEFPDDLNLADGITVSSGDNSGLGEFDGWNVDNNGTLRNDGGANAGGAYEGNFPSRYDDRTGGFWSITIPDDVYLDLDNIFFAVRGATGSNGGFTGRDIFFRTSLDGPTDFLYENLNLPARNVNIADEWLEISLDLTDAKYKNLNDTRVDFIWTTAGGAADLDGILISGTIVPSPTAALAGLLGLGGLMVRRRRG